MKNINTVKLIGLLGLALGGLGTLISGYAQQQTMDKTIEKKINEALAKREMEESE